MRYLTDWLMTLARDYLRTGELSLAQIANRTGTLGTAPPVIAYRFLV